MIIGQIRDGIVLDHITAGRSMMLYRVLGLDALDCTVAMIQNADSKKLGKKDIIKIGQVLDLDLDVLGYLDPGITVNIIRDGKLAKRSRLTLPERLVGICKCKNPRCITAEERDLPQEFRLTDREHRIYRCVYCDAQAPRDD